MLSNHICLKLEYRFRKEVCNITIKKKRLKHVSKEGLLIFLANVAKTALTIKNTANEIPKDWVIKVYMSSKIEFNLFAPNNKKAS
jgi:hypothetical protein